MSDESLKLMRLFLSIIKVSLWVLLLLTNLTLGWLNSRFLDFCLLVSVVVCVKLTLFNVTMTILMSGVSCYNKWNRIYLFLSLQHSSVSSLKHRCGKQIMKIAENWKKNTVPGRTSLHMAMTHFCTFQVYASNSLNSFTILELDTPVTDCLFRRAVTRRHGVSELCRNWLVFKVEEATGTQSKHLRLCSMLQPNEY